MHRFRLIVLLLFAQSVAVQSQPAKSSDKSTAPPTPPETWTIEAKDEVEFDIDKRIARATNGVVVRYRDAVLSARDVTIYEATGEVIAEGEVRLQRQGQVWISERLQYNHTTGQVVGEAFRTGQPPYFAQGDVLVADQRAGVYVAANGLVTTDDYDRPGYSVRAKTLIIVPGEYVEARDATLRLGNVPVMYFPRYRANFKRRSNHFDFVPGYRNRFGPFLLSSYNWYWNDRLDGALHFDARYKRGLAGGPDLNYHLPRFGEGTLKYYYADDAEPGEDSFGQPIDEDRQRFFFSHRTAVTSNLTVKAMARWQSDIFVVRDFFESEYRDNVQPSTFLEASQLWPNFGLNLLVQPRINDFYDTVERLPDLKLTGFRQQIATTPFFYESDSSLGYYRRKFAEDATNYFAATRADTYHQIVLPWTFFNWLNVTPRAGGRFTYYDEAHGPGATTSEQTRTVFNTGAEVSWKASRVWNGVKNRFWDLHGLRHIIQPSVNYVFVPHPSRAPRELPQFDYELPSTRLLPIDYPDYNAIDSIDSQNVLRFGLRNKLQTKRKPGIQNWVNWALYTDWRLNPRDDQETFADLYSDLDWLTFSWLALTSELRYDLNDHRWREANHSLTFTPNTVWSLSLSHRFLRDDPALGPDSGNNLISTQLYYRFSENWGVRLSYHYEMKDGTMEEQQYSLYRDFRSWTGAVTLRVRDNRDSPTDFTAAVTFSLKAHPRFGRGDDINKPSLLLGN